MKYCLLALLGFSATAAARGQAISLDETFQPHLGTNQIVSAMELQSDGRIIVAGRFWSSDGSGLSGAMRINNDGSLDSTFTLVDGFFGGLLIQTDGKLILGGTFFDSDGSQRPAIRRFTANGSFDPSFNAAISPTNLYDLNLALQPDEKILAAGRLTNSSVAVLYRLNRDGSRDNSFESALGDRFYNVNSLLALPDGGVLVAGQRRYAEAGSWTGLIRLHADGTIDNGFTAVSPGSSVSTIARQADGKILVGFDFDRGLDRLNPDGSVDTTFKPAGFSPILPPSHMESPAFAIQRIAIQADGRIMIGGWFNGVDGSPFEGLARLKADGSLDRGFYGVGLPFFDFFRRPFVRALVFQPDGKLLIAGSLYLNRTDPTTRGLVRLHPGPSIDQCLVRFDSANAVFETSEGTTFDLSVVREGCVDNPLAVDYATEDGAARAGFDYESLSGTITFNPGERVKMVSVIISADKLPESPDYSGTFPQTVFEDFTVKLRQRSAGTVLAFPSVATVKIRDSNYGVEFSRTNYVASESDGQILLEFRAVGGTARVFTADLTIVSGTAQSGTDFVVQLGPIMFQGNPPSVTTIPVAINDDSLFEGTEMVRFKLTNPSNGAVLGSQTEALLTLLENDTVSGPARGANGPVSAVLLQANGEILAAGDFTAMSGSPRRRIARLHPDLTLDDTFDPGEGPDAAVISLAQQSDGKVLLGGSFTKVANTSRKNIARLNADGSVDRTFDPGQGLTAEFSSALYTLFVQADGKILAGGYFAYANGTPRRGLVRFLPTGEVDGTFHPPIPELDLYCWGYATVSQITERLGGDFLIGGRADCTPFLAWLRTSAERMTLPFTEHVGMAIPLPDGRVIVDSSDFYFNWRLVRLQGDGSVDATFKTTSLGPYWPGGTTAPFAVLNDGRFVMALADRESLIDNSRSRLVRFEADGTPDFNFGAALRPNGSVNALAFLSDGKLLLGGEFTKLSSVQRLRLAVIDQDGNIAGVPRAQPVGFLSSDRFAVVINGGDGTSPFVIEISDDLRVWQPLQTNSLPTASFEFTDSNSSRLPHRFYRVRAL